MNSKKKPIKKILLLLFFNFLIFVSFYSLNIEAVHTHEMAHKEIAENHGCTEYRISQNIKGGGEFECLSYYDNINKEQEQMLHSINEIVSYNISSLISAISVLCLILVNTIMIVWIQNSE